MKRIKEMKMLTGASILAMMATSAFAGGHEVVEEKNGMYLNGNVEIYIDETYPEGTINPRAEAFFGYETEIDHPFASWVGAGARFDTNYSLDRTKDNQIQEVQMGAEIGYNTRLFMGNTDVQRLGFAKTSKIGAPVIITNHNSRIDHNTKVAVTFGGWDYDDEFKFNTYKLTKELPVGGVLAYDMEANALYASATARIAIVDLSYMIIENDVETQTGMSAGINLRPFGIAGGLGIEQWEDAGNTRTDYGAMYSVNRNVLLAAHRVEGDDVGFTHNYFSVLHTKNDVELGLHYHQGKSLTMRGRTIDIDDSLKATIKYNF
tara:strand:+ start:1398 stop:2354 length:957 start_codon:yes stop_codon:yes gene_type:complete